MLDHHWNVTFTGSGGSEPNTKSTTTILVDQAGHTLFKSDEIEDRGEADRLRVALTQLAQQHNRELALIVSVLRS